jgi:hypothetical protein
MRKLVLSLLLSLTFTMAIVALPAHTQENGNPDIKVWVNTASGVYHCPGTQWYGRTKRGRYMKQKTAQARGYRPAKGEVCD